MTYSTPQEAVAVGIPSVGPLRQFGLGTVVIAVLALIGAFFPASTLAAAVVALIALFVGLFCLIRDPGFNLPALAGTLLSSAAVAVAVIMEFVYTA